MIKQSETVAGYWAACEGRDWTTVGTLLAEDVVYDLPQTRERVVGRERFLRFNIEYPGDWHVAVERVVSEGRHSASWVRVAYQGSDLPALSFFEFDDRELISRITEFWPTPYDPPDGREHLVERY